MTPVEDVLAARSEDRLEMAMYYLRELTCSDAERLAHYCVSYGLTHNEATITHFLAVNGGRHCSRDQLMALLPETTPGSMAAQVCKVKKKLAGHAKITSRARLGYMMDAEGAASILCPEKTERHAGYYGRPIRQGRPWTRREIYDLRRMNESSSSLAAMAEEFDRTERAILDMLRKSGVGFHAYGSPKAQSKQVA